MQTTICSQKLWKQDLNESVHKQETSPPPLGRLLALRRRLARRTTRIRPTRRTTHRRLHHRRTHRSRPTDLARRPRNIDDLKNRCPTPRRPRRHPLPLETPRLQRQPLQRGPIQNPEEHATIP